jgi:hypothetical protein
MRTGMKVNYSNIANIVVGLHFQHSLEELLATDLTQFVLIRNPQNFTGAQIRRFKLQETSITAEFKLSGGEAKKRFFFL